MDGESDRVLPALHGLAECQVRLDRGVSDMPDALHHDLGDRDEVLLQFAFAVGLRDFAVPVRRLHRARRGVHASGRRPRQCRHHLGPAPASRTRAARRPHQRLYVSLSRRAVLGIAEDHDQLVADRRDHDVTLEAHLLSAAHDAAGGMLPLLDASSGQAHPRRNDRHQG